MLLYKVLLSVRNQHRFSYLSGKEYILHFSVLQLHGHRSVESKAGEKCLTESALHPESRGCWVTFINAIETSSDTSVCPQLSCHSASGLCCATQGDTQEEGPRSAEAVHVCQAASFLCLCCSQCCSYWFSFWVFFAVPFLPDLEILLYPFFTFLHSQTK